MRGMLSRFAGRVAETLRRDFLAGLLVFVPIGFTILAVLWIVERLDQMVLPRVFGALGFEGVTIPFAGVIVTLGVILLAGALTRSFIGRAVLALWERVVDRIPVARSFYSVMKQFMEAVVGESPYGSFQRVILVEYPRRGLWCYAFVTGTQDKPVEGAPDDLLKVFIPSTPNPTTGYFLLIPESDVVETGLGVEDAFKVIISAGIAEPADVRLPEGFTPAPGAVPKPVPE